MNLATDVIIAVFLTTITGGLFTVIWYYIGNILENSGFINIQFLFLKVTLAFWYIPIAYIVICGVNPAIREWRGLLFLATPVITVISWILAGIWAIVSIFMLCRYLYFLGKIRRRMSTASPCDEDVVAAFEEVCEQLGIKKGKVRILQSENFNVPSLVNVWRPTVVIPEGKVNKKYIRVYLAHELTHYRQRDVVMKNLAAIAFCFHFFNPLMRYFFKVVDKCSEFSCDYNINEYAGGMHPYFSAILVMLVGEERLRSSMSSSLVESTNSFIERVNHLNKIMNCKKRPKWVAALLVICMIVLNITTVSAASLLTANAYTAIYNLTDVERIEGIVSEETDCEEIIDNISDAGYEVREEKFETENARSMKSLNWSVGGKTLVHSSYFYAKSGGTIQILGGTDPSSKNVYIGIIEPDGTKRSIYWGGAFNHTFTLDTSGLYRIYVRNANSVTIDVSMTVIY